MVLDANILVRAVLGKRVLSLLLEYGAAVQYFAPESAFAEAEEHLPAILARRQIEPEQGLRVLRELRSIVQAVSEEIYSVFEEDSRLRMASRDLEDWPVLATALALDCPIWTEDEDFFGAGVATWTTDRIEIFLKRRASG